MITVFNVAVKFILAFLLLLLPLNTWASNQAMKDCLFEKMSQADPQMTLKQFSQMCSDEIAAQKKINLLFLIALILSEQMPLNPM